MAKDKGKPAGRPSEAEQDALERAGFDLLLAAMRGGGKIIVEPTIPNASLSRGFAIRLSKD